jgi:hypothetical protein
MYKPSPHHILQVISVNVGEPKEAMLHKEPRQLQEKEVTHMEIYL